MHIATIPKDRGSVIAVSRSPITLVTEQEHRHNILLADEYRSRSRDSLYCDQEEELQRLEAMGY